MTTTSIIILAAGSSSRLGQPKQLLSIEGETLLNRTIRFATEVSTQIIVVLGAYFEVISKSITNKSVLIIENIAWETGMASTIKAGLSKCLEAENVIICLCDQPYLSGSIFENLIKHKSKTNLAIVASEYSGKIGVPILFNKLIFNDLMNLEGEKGASSILKNLKENIAAISFPNGEIDIDTFEDWEYFQQKSLFE
jgi:molybdenum cofactor cytidylyltransferase